MRGKKAIKRDIKPDSKYGSVTLSKFINYVMKGGKKSTAQRIVYEALDKMAVLAKKEAIEVFNEAISTVSPQVEVRSKRVGGANYQVPIPVRGERQNSLAFRWIIGAAQAKKGQPMAQKLATVLFEASQGLGDAIKKRDDVHRMAEANKAFAHFARFAK
ncbi:MAG: 30S ribosomal protein S7 [Candidatus Magasanikbacteria bacterium]|nr:30S ribosomal protein S7 [Candidatus Magasanikbacteria bacterium]